MKKVIYKITSPRGKIYISVGLTGGSKTRASSIADESGKARTA